MFIPEDEKKKKPDSNTPSGAAVSGETKKKESFGEWTDRTKADVPVRRVLSFGDYTEAKQDTREFKPLTYDNSAAKKTVGGYYSFNGPSGEDYDRAAAGVQKYGDLFTRSSDVMTAANGKKESYEKDLKEREKELASLSLRARMDKTGGAAALYNRRAAEYQRAYGEYKDFYDNTYKQIAGDHELISKQYGKYATAYDGYNREAEKRREEWKKTVRDEKTVEAELATARERAENLGKEKAQYGELKRNNDIGYGTWAAWGNSADPGALAQYAKNMEEREKLFADAEAKDKEYEDAQETVKLLEEELGYSKKFKYEAYKDAKDFEEKSAYAPTDFTETQKKGRLSYIEEADARSAAPILTPEQNTETIDELYEAINGDAVAKSVLNIKNELGYAGAELGNMTDDEKAIFNYLYHTDKDEAVRYFEGLLPSLNAQERGLIEKGIKDWTKESWVNAAAGSAATVLMSPLKTLSFLGQTADFLKNGKIDQNAAYNLPSFGISALRGAVTEDSDEVGSFLYQTGMSIADFLYNAFITGGLGGTGGKLAENLSLAIMGASAAADTVIEQKDRGMDDTRAFILGTVAGLAEIVTEKVSLEALLSPDLEKGALRYIVKNVLAEGSEEGASDLINYFADDLYDLISGQDASKWHEAINNYIAKGYTESEAFGRALADRAGEVGLDMLGGALSGEVMAGGSAGIHQYQTSNMSRNRATGRQLDAMSLDGESYQAIINEGLAAPEGSGARIAAEQLKTKLDAGKNISNTEYGRLMRLNEAQIAEETIGEGAGLIHQALEQVDEEGKPTYNSAKAILNNEAALRILSENTGIDLSSPMSVNDRIEAVRDAVARYDEAAVRTAAEERAAKAQRNAAETTGNAGADLLFETVEQNRKAADERAQKVTELLRITPAQNEQNPAQSEQNPAQSEQISTVEGIEARQQELMNEAAELRDAGAITPETITRLQEINREYQALEQDKKTLRAAEPFREIIEKGGNRNVTEGMGVHDDGMRADNQGSEGQSQSLYREAGRTEENQNSGRARSTKEGYNLSEENDSGSAQKVTYGETVHTSYLGIKNGSDYDAIRLVTGENADIREAREILEDAGIEPVFFGGGNLHIDGMTARGALSDGKAYIRVDDPRFSAQQIALHERAHAEIAARGDEAIYDLEDRIVTRIGEEALNYAMDIYRDALQDANMTHEEILEELIADALADMNGARGAGEIARTMDRILGDVKAEADDYLSRTEKKSASGSGGESLQETVKTSISFTDKGKPFVLVDKDILLGVPKKKWNKTVNQHMRQAYPNGISVKNSIIRVDADTIREMTHSKYTQWLRANVKQIWGDKLRATNNIDEILTATTDWKNENPNHKRKDNIVDFGCGTVLLRIGTHDYKARVVVGGMKNGNMRMYDIVDIQETSFKEKKAPAPQAAYSSPSTRRKGADTSSVDRIADATANVNTKTSRATEDSEGEIARLTKENRKLEERVTQLNGQTVQTKNADEETLAQIWKKDSGKLAKQFKNRFASTMSVSDIAKEVRYIAQYLAQGEEDGHVIYGKVREMTTELASKIVNSASMISEDFDAEAYREIKNALRGGSTKEALILNKDYKGDFDAYGGWNAWHKAHFGKVNLKLVETGDVSGRGVDTLYKELAAAYPWAFKSANEVINPFDQLMAIVAAEEALRPVYENPYSADLSVAVEDVTNQILDTLIDTDRFWDKPSTFADREAIRRQRIQDEADERVKKAVEREADKRREQVAKIRKEYAEANDAYFKRKADSEARQKLLKTAQRLKKMKTTGAVRAEIDGLIGNLDTVAVSLTGRKASELRSLEQWYNEQLKDPDWIPNERVKKDLARLSNKHISEMSLNDVHDLTNALLHIENEQKTAKKLINEQDQRDTSKMGDEIIRNVKNSRGVKASGLAHTFDTLVVNETLSPVRMIRKITGYVASDPLYKATLALNDGQTKAIEYRMNAYKPFNKWMNNKKFIESITGANAKEIKITAGGGVFTITPAMRMSLYLHSLNDQNLMHIKLGGVTIPDIKLYKKGKVAEAYARGATVKMTPTEVKSIASHMTAEEREFANAIRKYFNETSKSAINKTSVKLLGYELAEVVNYFPINTNSAFIKDGNNALIKFDGSIEGQGWTKERIKAANPILLRGAEDVLLQSIDQHARYVGMAIPVRNINKLLGVTQHDVDESGRITKAYTGSVAEAVENKWGTGAWKYVQKMLADVQGVSKAVDSWGEILNKVRSNYAAAVLTLNASVAMKQAASYPTAAAVLGWGPLAKAMKDFGKVDLELIAKYTPLQWWRSQGYSTAELGELKKQGKSLPALLNWIQGIDLATTRKLWKASEYYVQDHNTDLKVGTEEYYQAVADIYNRVLQETQPNYDVMQRPQLLRSENELVKSLAMFKTQPFQNFNIVYDAWGQMDAAARAYKANANAETKAAYKEAKANFGRAVSSQLVSAAVFAAMTFAWNAFRGKLKRYKDKDGEVNFFSVLAGVGKSALESLTGMVPFGSDLYEAIDSLVSKDIYYGFSGATESAIGDLVKGIESVITAFTKEEISVNELRLKFGSLANSASKVFGVPVENVTNIFNATFRWAAIAAEGQYKGEYAYLRLTESPSSKSADYYDLLYKSYNKDEASYRDIYRAMVDSGYFDEKKVRSAMEDRMKKEAGVKKVEELPHRWLTPDQQEQRDDIIDMLVNGTPWKQADEERRRKADEYIFDILIGNSDGQKQQEKIEEASAYGISADEYINFLLALSVVDKPTESGKTGTYTNGEIEEAINLVDGLTAAEKTGLWLSKGKNEKNMPNW